MSDYLSVAGGGKGSTTVVDLNTQLTNTENYNTNYAGNEGVVAGDGSPVNITTTNSSSTTTLDGGVIKNAFAFADNAGSNSLDVFNNALTFSQNTIRSTFSELSDLVTYNQSSLTSLVGNTIGSLTDSLSGAVAAIRQDNNKSLEFFAGQTDNLLRASNSNVDKLVNQTLKAVKTTADAAQSQDAQQLTQLQSTLIKLALGMGVIIVAVAYFARRKG